MSMVEWKKMWEVTTWDKRFNGIDKCMQPSIIKYHYYLAKDLEDLVRDNGDVRILYTTEEIAFTNSYLVENHISEGEIVAIPWGGNTTVKYYKGKFITADNRIATSNDTQKLHNKFLYYWMLSRKTEIESYYRGAGIKHPSMYKVLNMEIPIPSLQEQERIVGILDTFTAAIDNLKKQIEERRKQYEFYRDQLLDLEGKEGVEMVPLKNVADIGTGSSNTNEGLEQGEYPFYTRGKEVLRKNEYEYDETSIITAGDGVGVGKVFHFVSGKYALHQRAYRIHINKKDMNPRFVYYYMVSTFETYIRMKSFFAAVTSVRKPMLYSYPIPKCPLSQQQQIVAKLDAFEASIANLEQQLAMRQKQYEYYRNKLLSFE